MSFSQSNCNWHMFGKRILTPKVIRASCNASMTFGVFPPGRLSFVVFLVGSK